MRLALKSISVIVLATIILSVSTTTALGDESGEATALRELDTGGVSFPLQQSHRMMAGRNWLITSGSDPTLGPDLRSANQPPVNSGARSPSQQAGGGGAALVPYRDPSAKFSRNILIPTDFSTSTFQTEPSIAVDPRDPDHLLVGMIDYSFPDMVTYSSIDGGATWEGPVQAKYPRKDLAAAGDPIVAFDRNGNAFYAYISLDIEEFTVGPIASSAVVSSISVSTSLDGGLTWENPTRSHRSSVVTKTLPTQGDGRPRGELELGFLDKPWMTIGPHPEDGSKDIIYMAYTKFVNKAKIFWIDELPFLGAPSLETVIELVRSEDQGFTWSDPIEVSPRAQYSILFNKLVPGAQEQLDVVRQVVQGPDVAVGPDGTVYVAWLDTTEDDSFEGLAEIYVRRSDDGGKSFKSRKRVSTFPELGFTARSSNFRSWASAFPKLSIGPQGQVYVVWVALPTDDPDDDGDVYIATSINKGATWSRRAPINDDAVGSPFQFFPEVSTDPSGTVHVMWGDMRDDPSGVGYHIYYSASEDEGKTWSINSRVTDFLSNPNRAFPGGRFLGDYFGIEAIEEEVYMVWADARLGEFGPTNQKIGFARKRLMPSPSVFISPPSGPGGQDIVVQGFNFQPERDIFIEVAGVIVSTARTHEDGRFSTQIFVPISGKGAHTIRVIEESGNIASTSFFMDFGFDTIQETTDMLEEVSGKIEILTNGGGDNEPSLRDDLQALQEQIQALGQSNGNGSSGSGLRWAPLLVAAFLLPIVVMGGIVIFLMRRRIANKPPPDTSMANG